VSEPTLGEVVRRLDGVAQQITNLVNKMDADRRRDADTYVNRGEYAEYQKRVESQIDDHSKDIDAINEARKDDARWRRTASLTLAVAAAGWVVTIALFVATLLGA
jgi:hypothetical protein